MFNRLWIARRRKGPSRGLVDVTGAGGVDWGASFFGEYIPLGSMRVRVTPDRDSTPRCHGKRHLVKDWELLFVGDWSMLSDIERPDQSLLYLFVGFVS